MGPQCMKKQKMKQKPKTKPKVKPRVKPKTKPKPRTKPKRGKKPVRNAKVQGGKARKLRELKKKAGITDPIVPPPEDKFADEDTPLKADDIEIFQPADWDVRDELDHLDGFRDYVDESRGNTLSYGDY
jgi:hypothetical protein